MALPHASSPRVLSSRRSLESEGSEVEGERRGGGRADLSKHGAAGDPGRRPGAGSGPRPSAYRTRPRSQVRWRSIRKKARVAAQTRAWTRDARDILQQAFEN